MIFVTSLFLFLSIFYFCLEIIVVRILPRFILLEDLDTRSIDILLRYSKEIAESKFGCITSKVYRKKLPKEFIGFYDASTNRITIDIRKMHKKELTVFDFVCTAIHEFTHEYQHKSDPKFLQKYNLWESMVGYDLNPYELQARRQERLLAPKVFLKFFEESH